MSTSSFPILAQVAKAPSNFTRRTAKLRPTIFAQDAKPNSNITRRTANYHPSIWGDCFLSYVPTSVEGDDHIKQVQLLKEDVRKMLVSPIENHFSFKLNFIDSIQRLGVSYHFEHEIDEALQQIYNISTEDNNIITRVDDPHHLALLFRLLRQQGHHISSNVFYKFKDQSGNFNERLANDIQGMLSLYEASQLRLHGEEILEEAHNFTLIQLTKSLTTQLNPSLAAQVNHILGQSFRKGMPRLEARYYISFYQEDPSHDENLLNFAKLDFNMLQKLHKKEVNSATKWWIEELNVSTKLPFVRDRIVEAYFWILGIYFEPQYSIGRRMMVKMFGTLTIVDDMYDAYATFEELELFTNAIERWDICSLVDLPEYMKLCYTTLFDVVKEIEQELRKQGKAHYIKYVKKEVKKIVHAYFIEAKWLHCNHTPTTEEYMQVATITIGCPLFTSLSFLDMEDMEDTIEEVLTWATSNPKILADASIICRVMNDIAGNKFEQERGHVDSIVECHMKQHNSSRQNAIEELLNLVESSWKDINEACLNPTQVPMIFLMRIVNFARMMNVFYKGEDTYTNPEGTMKDYIQALLVNKIPTI